MQHHRTAQVEWSMAQLSGGHLLHLALAQCVFNNVLRIARDRELSLVDVSVVADGNFNADGTASTGFECTIELTGDADDSALAAVAEAAFEDSTVVAVLRATAPVKLASVVASRWSDSQPPNG